MNKIAIGLTLGISLLSVTVWPVQAETIAQTTEAPSARQPWLGVTLAPVPPAVSKQLSALLPAIGQGVMIESVSPGSPAARAGLQRWDLLLTMGDQKLFSPQQLAGLVAASKPGETVSFEVIRNGKRERIEATLGNAPTMAMGHPHRWQEHPRWRPRLRPWGMIPDADHVPGLRSGDASHVMEQFEAIAIRKLGDDHYRAEIEFLDDNGEKKHFSVEGSYDEVRRRIADNDDLPDDRKRSLLNALRINPDILLPDRFGGLTLPPPPPMPGFPDFDELLRGPDSWF